MSDSASNRSSASDAVERFRLLEQRLGVEPGRIAGLRRDSDLFAEICADYEECCAKLQSLAQAKPGADDRRHDFLEMLDQLERELERHLTGVVPPPR